MSADAILALLGDIASAVAAAAAVVALWYASKTIRDARADRREAELVRLIRRVELVAETVEALIPRGLRMNDWLPVLEGADAELGAIRVALSAWTRHCRCAQRYSGSRGVTTTALTMTSRLKRRCMRS